MSEQEDRSQERRPEDWERALNCLATTDSPQVGIVPVIFLLTTLRTKKPGIARLAYCLQMTDPVGARQQNST